MLGDRADGARDRVGQGRDGRFRIEQGGDAGAERGGGSQQVGGVGEGNARPILTDAVGVFLEPGGGVADGEGVVPG